MSSFISANSFPLLFSGRLFKESILFLYSSWYSIEVSFFYLNIRKFQPKTCRGRQQRDDYARELMDERFDKVMDEYNNCWIPDN